VAGGAANPRTGATAQSRSGAAADPRSDRAAEPPRSRAAGPLPPVERQAPIRVSGGADFGGGKAGVAAAPPAVLRDDRWAGLIAAAVGMLLAWAIAEVLGIPRISTYSRVAQDAVAALYFGCIAVIYGAVVLGFDPAVDGAWDQALPRVRRAVLPALAAGVIAGVIAAEVFRVMFNSVLESGSFSGPGDIRFYVAQAVAWMVFGGALGAVLGFIEGSRALMINRLLGGLAGGAFGGIVVQFTAVTFDADGRARLLGLLAIGLLVAVATRFIEHARRDAWLRVTSGGMAGKEFILYHDVTRIGSSPECEIFLIKDPDVANEHARIASDGDHRTLTATPGATVLVNNAPVTTQRLRGGESIQIGNSVLAYSERQATAIA
jgi:hypothetical protein